MHRRYVSILWLAAIAGCLSLAAVVRSDEELESLVGYTGPPLWRVNKGDHELWLFGTLSAIPKHTKWSPVHVERVIADADQVLLPPGINASSLKPLQLLRVWFRARELSASPDGRPLAEVLPADLYLRYSKVRDRYVRRPGSLEEQRPVAVALRLYQGAVEQMGFASGRDVQNGIERIAKRAGVETVETQLHVDIEALLDYVSRVSPQAEVECFDKVIGALEAGETRGPERVQAWASGNIAALRDFDFPDIQRDCLALPGWPEDLQKTLRAANDEWLAAAERALADNRSTFGTLDVRNLMNPNGLLAQLQERGYEVQRP